MAADYLSSRLKSRLHLTTKTVGEDRIKKAKENNEDVAVLSMFLPDSLGKSENSRFRCALGSHCKLGDHRLATPGNIAKHSETISTSSISLNEIQSNPPYNLSMAVRAYMTCCSTKRDHIQIFNFLEKTKFQ